MLTPLPCVHVTQPPFQTINFQSINHFQHISTSHSPFSLTPVTPYKPVTSSTYVFTKTTIFLFAPNRLKQFFSNSQVSLPSIPGPHTYKNPLVSPETHFHPHEPRALSLFFFFLHCFTVHYSLKSRSPAFPFHTAKMSKLHISNIPF